MIPKNREDDVVPASSYFDFGGAKYLLVYPYIFGGSGFILWINMEFHICKMVGWLVNSRRNYLERLDFYPGFTAACCY